MSYFASVKLIDTAGAPQGVLFEDGCPAVRDYGIGIAEGEVAKHSAFHKIGYASALTTTQADIWGAQSAQATYIWPTAATQMAVVSDSASDDGTPASPITGTATGGTANSKLIDTGKNFTTAGIAAGDLVVIDKSGTPFWGYVSSVSTTTNANDTLNFAAGLSNSAISPASKDYIAIAKAGSTGCHAVIISYLDAAYAEANEIVVTNGTAEVNLVNDPFRVQAIRAIGTGSANSAVGNISVKGRGVATTIYRYLSAGTNRGRGSPYTTPAGKTLYVDMLSFGYGNSAGTKIESARMYFRTNREPATGFHCGAMFFHLAEVVSGAGTVMLPMKQPIIIPPQTDIKCSGIATAAGTAVASYRGWLETE